MHPVYKDLTKWASVWTIIYTRKLFRVAGLRFLSAIGFSTKTRSFPETSRDFPGRSEALRRRYEHFSVPGKDSRNTMAPPDLTWTFFFLPLVQVYIFFESVSVKVVLNYSNVSVRREILVCRRE